jgi:hypothetical protein
MHSCVGLFDSQRYRVGYEINSPSDIPEGFCVPFHAGSWHKAIFLPGERHNGWRTAQQVPRIYILTQRGLFVYAHPACRELPFVAHLDELISVTSQEASLFGSVELSTLCCNRSFRYDPAHKRYMKSLLSALRNEWLPFRVAESAAVDLKQLDPPLEMRCRYAMELELDAEESILCLCSQPQTYGKTRARVLTRRQLSSASCLVLTNRRIMTIASQFVHANRQSEITISYAALANAASAEIERHNDGFTLSLKLSNDRAWKICLADMQAASASECSDSCATRIPRKTSQRSIRSDEEFGCRTYEKSSPVNRRAELQG